VEPISHFGFGKNDVINEISVVWPDNKESVLKDIQANNLVKVEYAEAIHIVNAFG